MKPLLIIAGLVAAAVTANAQIILWSPEVLIQGASDVQTNGTYFDALQGFGAQGRPDQTVNTVLFHAHHDTFTDGALSFGGPGLADGFGGSASTPDATYNTVLTGNSYVYSGSIAPVGTITIGGPSLSLTPGHEYQVQIFETYGTTAFSGATPADSVTIDAGYYAVGDFIATGSTANISFVDNDIVSAVTALSVRDLGVIPEPSTYGLMGLGLLALVAIRRWRSRVQSV